MEVGNQANKTMRRQAIGFETAKLPPQAVDLEEAVLGALMLERDAFRQVIPILSQVSFYKSEHELIFSAIKKLWHSESAIDILTVTQQLRLTGELEAAGGAYYLSELTNRVGSAANIEYHAMIVQQKYIMRKLIEISSNTQREAFDETTDVFDLLAKTEADLLNIHQQNFRVSEKKLSEISVDTYKRVSSRTNGGLVGLPTGLSGLDSLMSGLRPGNMIIIAARPSMGKTSLALSISRNLALENVPVAILSMEMSAEQLCMNFFAMQSGLENWKIEKGKLHEDEWNRLNYCVAKIEQMPVYIDESPSITALELRAKCLAMKAKYGIKLFIIDYLQLMSGNGNKQSREQEISEISRKIKAIAKETHTPFIALSQLSRAVETRGGVKRPILSDLRESGSIEQDADQVIFIFRPEYYNITESDSGEPTKGLAELIVAKNRNGATGTVECEFAKEIVLFRDRKPPSKWTSITNKISRELTEEETPF